MQKNLKKLYFLVLLALLLALVIAFNPLSASGSSAYTTWTGRTTYWANVRTGPSTGSGIVAVYAPNTQVTVYATVSGQVVWGGISNWYRISGLSSSPRYIYGGLVVSTTSTGSGGDSGGSPSPTASGKEILVSLSHQWMWVYDNHLAMAIWFALLVSVDIYQLCIGVESRWLLPSRLLVA